MVDSPNYVRVDRIESDENVMYFVFCKQGELGQIIGNGGTLGNAIRKIMKCAAKKHNLSKRVYLDIRE